MHHLTTPRADPRADSDDTPYSDQRHETRMAWIAALWAAMAILATVIAIWDGRYLSP